MPTTKHGHNLVGFKTPEYISWNHMKDRCYNKNHIAFHRYGGRGIEVCKEWRNNFLSFFLDVGKRPSPTHRLERINNDGNYERKNVRWATPKEQAQNRVSNNRIEINGITKCAAAWAAEIGVGRHTVSRRYASGVRGSDLLRSSLHGKRFKDALK